MTPAEGRRQRTALMKEIAREHRRQARAHLFALRQAIHDARAAHKHAIVHAKTSCRAARLDARRKASELRARLLLELRVAVKAERQAAYTSCKSLRGEARSAKDRKERARLELLAERKFRREMRQIERSNRARRAELVRASRKERQQESDDEVRGNIPPELVALFDRVGRKIKGSDRMTRTEAFLHYAEEHPREVLLSIEDKTEETIRELERQAAKAEREMTRPLSDKELSSEVPF
jgi:hypothetical protein